MGACANSPNGRHDPIPDVVEVIIKGKKVREMVIVCFWCGKIL
jgi:hypothetical protein